MSEHVYKFGFPRGLSQLLQKMFKEVYAWHMKMTDPASQLPF